MKNKSSRLVVSILKMVFITLFACTSLQGGGALFSRRIGTDEQYEKMWIKSMDVAIDIQDQIAVTHVDHVFFNERTTMVEAIFIFSLPENALITEMVYWFNGQRYVADIRERQDAVAAYQSKIRRYIDPVLLEYLGDNLFRLSIAPINAQSEVRTEITYTELLDYSFGMVDYQYRLNTVDLSSQPLETVVVNLSAQAQTPFVSFEVPSHENSSAASLTQISDSEYEFLFGDELFYPDRDLHVRFETVREGVNVNLLTYTPTTADSFGTESYYALWLTPPNDPTQEQIVPKDMLFVADVSSSMDGLRMEQLKAAMNSFLDDLDSLDRFNIITFGTNVVLLNPDLVAADSAHIAAAQEYIYSLYALGLTNIQEALLAALNQSYRDTVSRNIVFLTDGLPTWGETDVPSIIANVHEADSSAVRIFSFGIGSSEELSMPLLVGLSTQNGGTYETITADDSIAIVVGNFTRMISMPVMVDLVLDLGGANPWDNYPKTIGDLFWGHQLLQLGLYNQGGTHTISVTGNLGTEPFLYSEELAFSDSAGKGHRFVPRLWAKSKIDDLYDMIAFYGESDELVDQIIELSLRYQILTTYTAFYADPDDDNTAVTVADNEILPGEFKLHQNHPNPFNSSTTISYQLPVTQQLYDVRIKIYNIRGELVVSLMEKDRQPGYHSIRWDGTGPQGQELPSGIYFCTVSAGPYRATIRLVLLK